MQPRLNPHDVAPAADYLAVWAALRGPFVGWGKLERTAGVTMNGPAIGVPAE